MFQPESDIMEKPFYWKPAKLLPHSHACLHWLAYLIILEMERRCDCVRSVFHVKFCSDWRFLFSFFFNIWNLYTAIIKWFLIPLSLYNDNVTQFRASIRDQHTILSDSKYLFAVKCASAAQCCSAFPRRLCWGSSLSITLVPKHKSRPA